jgi:hypothetical protein
MFLAVKRKVCAGAFASFRDAHAVKGVTFAGQNGVNEIWTIASRIKKLLKVLNQILCANDFAAVA